MGAAQKTDSHGCTKTRENTYEQFEQTGVLVMTCTKPEHHGGKHLDPNEVLWG